MDLLRAQRGIGMCVLAAVLILSAGGGVLPAAAEGTEGADGRLGGKVVFTNPVHHSIVHGIVDVRAMALGGVPVSSVTFYVDGMLQAMNDSPPYGFSWDVSNLKNDTRHLLTLKAFSLAASLPAQSMLVTVKSGVASSSMTVKVSHAAAELVASSDTASGMALRVALQGSGFMAGDQVFYDGPSAGIVQTVVESDQSMRFILPLPSAAAVEATAADSYVFVVQSITGDQGVYSGLTFGVEAGSAAPTFGSVYVFPNPWVRGHGKPLTFHADVPSGALVGANVKIFNVRGFIIQQKEMSPAAVGGGYNFAWSDFDLASGVYLYEVELQFAGGSHTITNGKLAVIR